MIIISSILYFFLFFSSLLTACFGFPWSSFRLPLILMTVAYFHIIRILWKSDTIPGHRESQQQSKMCKLTIYCYRFLLFILSSVLPFFLVWWWLCAWMVSNASMETAIFQPFGRIRLSLSMTWKLIAVLNEFVKK